MKIKFLVISLIILSLFVVSACTKNVDDKTNGENSDGENSQIANPASTFCVQNGGKSDIRTAYDNSQVGYCIINGEECEEWALMRGECPNMHICTAEEKAAEICTLEYMPVCGNDNKTYGNKCSACSAKIDYWTAQECGAECGDCPYLSPPAPGFCLDGEIVASKGKDRCGCSLPPTCEQKLNECGETCPDLASPDPSFCSKGTIVSGDKDECGCNKLPVCVPCGDCPLIGMPSPTFCANGTIISGGKDNCGCEKVPTCQR